MKIICCLLKKGVVDRMKGVRCRLSFGVIAILCIGMNITPAECVQTDTGVSDYAALKAVLEQGGTKSISLVTDIPLEDEIQVRGCKMITGKGHTLFRTSGNDKNLFVVENASMTIRNVSISGRKEKQEETVAAFWIKQKGMLTMDGGELTEHYNAAGGPAVRIEPGGCFEIRAGAIQNNKAVATGKRKGKDARGGAIVNGGKIILTGGILSHNEAIGDTGGLVNYGGIGGMLYNQGECIIGKAVVKDNYATSAGMDMFHEPEAVCREIKESSNSSPKGQTEEKKTSRAEVKTKSTEKAEKKVHSEDKNKKKKEEAKGKHNQKKKKGEKNRTSKAGRKEKKSGMVSIYRSARYLFEWEIRDYSESDWKRKLINGCESLERDGTQWNWNGLLENKKGQYFVRVTTKEKVEHIIPVTVVSETRQENEPIPFIRFYKPEEKNGKKQTWRFLSRDIKEAKKYLRQQKNPLSREANQTFYKEFVRCKQ